MLMFLSFFTCINLDIFSLFVEPITFSKLASLCSKTARFLLSNERVFSGRYTISYFINPGSLLLFKSFAGAFEVVSLAPPLCLKVSMCLTRFLKLKKKKTFNN